MELEHTLRSGGIWSDKVMRQLDRMGIESIGDLAFTFESADEVMTESPDLLEA